MNSTLLYDSADTICAISTPAGSGGIAVIRISGKDAITITDKIWKGRRLSAAATHTAHLGEIVDPNTGQIIDQSVATVFRAPGTFTGEDVVEVSVHGSRWIQKQLIALLCRQGCRGALPGEFTRRAYASGKLDLAQAEAVADVIASSSQAAHRLAMSQLRGQYSHRLSQMRQQLVDLASLLELELDFSEEDVEFASRDHLLQLATSLKNELGSLADTFDTGAAIKDGIPVAIIGPTNAGKSSLLNALLGDERAIVSDIHGTTRDIVEDTLEIGPYLIRFRDTAGLRYTDDTIEQLGIERSHRAARSAQIIIYVVDPTQPETNDIPDDIPSERIIYAINKTDTGAQEALTYPSESTVRISARTGEGIDQLKDLIQRRIAALTPSDTENALIVTNARHAQAMRSAATSAAAVIDGLRSSLPPDLIAQNLREAIRHLASVTGEITTPELLQNIFENFCIGK